MIERYIYAVTRELPEQYRAEIADELEALINDLLTGMDMDVPEERKVEAVLRELGNPKELANRYRGKERYLIGPKLFEQYLFVLKIVVLSVFVGISVATGISVMFSGDNAGELVLTYVGSLFSAVLQGAAWVTGIFALLEYKDVSLDSDGENEQWDPRTLPEIPARKALIPRGESVFAIIATTVFLPLFFFFADKIGIYYKVGNDIEFLPVFMDHSLAALKVTILVVFVLNILSEVIKLVKGRWTLRVALATTALDVISASWLVLFLNRKDIWQDEFVSKFEQYSPLAFGRVILLITSVIIIVTVLEAGAALYKGLKYGRRE
ncbi:MAG: hypothetical protein GX588_02515 [Clostridiaceae bacterium]|nr:hypothetical protein [Clostridiaceae bacterium]